MVDIPINRDEEEKGKKPAAPSGRPAGAGDPSGGEGPQSTERQEEFDEGEASGWEAAAPGTETPSADEIRALAARAAERDEYYDKFLRAKAELENFRKRMQRERENMQDFAIIDIMRGLLPVLDDLDRALNAAQDNRHVRHFLKGVKLIESQLFKVLEEKGVKPIKCVGEKFDPNVHEALTVEAKSDKPDDTVVAELQRGYIYRDKVVRPAKVIVAKKS